MHRVTIPLHPAQKDVYTDQLVKGNSPLYNVGGYICLNGKLNSQLLIEVVSGAPVYFDAFKMRFNLQAADFKTYLDHSNTSIPVIEIDFSLDASPAATALRWMQSKFNQPFVFNEKDLLVEQALIKISEDEHWFYGKYHHLITDGYGFIIWIKYLAETYNARSSGASLAINYPAYQPAIKEAAQFLQSLEYQNIGDYWKQKLQSRPPQLLRKKAIITEKNNSSKAYIIEATPAQMALIEQLKINTGAGLLQLTLAALSIYFAKATGEAESIIGVPVHKRGSRQLRNIVGMFSGILPFKNTYNPQQTLQQALTYISRSLKDDLKNQSYILGDIARDLELQAGDKLFDVIVNYEPFNFQVDFGEDVQATIYQLAANQADHALQFTWQDHGKQQPLILNVAYQLQFFDKPSIRYIIDSLFKILNQFITINDKHLSTINILGEAELEALQAVASVSHLEFSDVSLATMFTKQALLTPNATALIHDEQKVTYQQLHERSNQVANYLLSLNLSPETLIPVCIERGINMVVAILGILKAGAAYVPVDPAYPADRIQYMLHDCKAAIVITSKIGKAHLPFDGNYKTVEIDDASLFAAQPLTAPAISISSKQLAYVIYTSGSTGNPKGVMIDHSSAVAFINWCQQEFAAEQFDIVYAVTSICFDLSVFELMYPLSIGKPVRILENGLSTPDYLPLDQNVLLNTVPTVIENLLHEKVSLQNVTVINMAGEPVPAKVLNGLDTEKITLRNLYGPTEDTTYSTVYKLHKNEPILIGKPIANSSVYLLNRQHELVPYGMPGEICLGGAGLARGYLNRPELTDEKFIANPFAAGERLYKTGDLGCWTQNGNLEYLGRIDNQVKLRGYRIELGEIENAIEQSGLVQNAVVIVQEDKTGGKFLAAYIVAENTIDTNSLIAYLKAKLPDYMVPARWTQLSSLPLTPNGKIDRKNLPLPELSENSTREFVAPATQVEKELVVIWQQVLGLENISTNDNFFELGGHSIKAIQVLSRLHKSLNIKIDFSQFAMHPTIRQFAMAIQGQVTTNYVNIPKVEAREFYELSHAQKRMYVLCQLPGGSVSLNSPAAFELQGKVEANMIEQAVKTLVNRHESLRTLFVEHNGEAIQKILQPGELQFQLHTHYAKDGPQPTDNMMAYMQEEALTEFDLAKGPLFKAILVVQSNEKQTLFFNIHHIVSDGWSKGILINDFIQILTALSLQQIPALQPLTVTYKDYAAWQKNLIQQQQPYWKQTLTQDISVLQFPLDFERPAVVTFKGELLQARLSDDISRQLKNFCNTHNLTLNNVLFALYGLMVAHYSNQQNVIVGTLTSGRSHADLEEVVGLFINFLPIVMQVNREGQLLDYLQSTQQTLANAYSNQDYPFDLMVENFVAARDFSRNPFFDTMVNFHSENEVATEYQIGNRTSAENLTIKPLPHFKENQFQSNLDFKLDIETVDAALLFNVTYNTKLFSQERMQNFLNAFTNLVNKVVTDPLDVTANYLTTAVAPGLVQIIAESKQPFQVCISGTFVCEPLLEYISYWGDEYDLNLEVKFADYNQVFQQLLNPASLLNTNKGINVLLVGVKDWLREKTGLTTAEVIAYLDKTYADFIQALEFSATRNYTPILVGIVTPQHNSLQAAEVNNHISLLTAMLETYVTGQRHFVLLDLNKAAALYEVDNIFDEAADEMGHIPFTQEFFAALGTYIARKIRSYRSKVYKVIALDCDNTLWKGIVGELGYQQVSVNEHFTYLQNFLIEKYNEGYLLVLASKNNEADVWEVFDKNPGMKLKRSHIAAHRINWNDKPLNISAIAAELNVGVDSFIFIDDSSFEVEQMQMATPEVLALNLPAEDEEIKSFIDHTWELDVFKITNEDVQRNQMYQTEKSRKDEETKHGSLADFMKALEIKVTVRNLLPADLDRSVQLSLRTNQFNMNGIRRTAEEVTLRLRQPSSYNRVVEVSDRFGDYGLVGLLLGHEDGNALMLDTFLMSCRVLGRGVEEMVLESIKNYCIEAKLQVLRCSYMVTPRNKPFEVFLNKAGWQPGLDGEAWQLQIKYSTEEIAL